MDHTVGESTARRYSFSTRMGFDPRSWAAPGSRVGLASTPVVHTEIEELPHSRLAEYSTISIAFEVTERVRSDDPPSLRTQPVTPPYRKDYDAIEGGAPHTWPLRYDLAAWTVLIARAGGIAVGGAAVAPASLLSEISLPTQSAVLWDIRVRPEERGRGIGTALYGRAEGWARARGYRCLVAETQDVNVAACRFYRRMGMQLAAFEPGVYPMLPDEARMLWRRELSVDRLAG